MKKKQNSYFKSSASEKGKIRHRGFSFIEVLVVIIIVGILSGLAGITFFDSFQTAKSDTTKTQIKKLGTALDIYRLHNDRYPSSEQGLKALLSRPEVGLIPKNWNGPYIRNSNVPKDSWGTPFRYISETGRNFEIISLGANGFEGGSDLDVDIKYSDI